MPKKSTIWQAKKEVTQMGLWIYRAYDEDGLPVAEAYREQDLINKLEDEFGCIEEFTIKRIYEKWLQ